MYVGLFLTASAQSNDKSYLSNRYSLERMGTIGAGSNSVPGLPPANPEVIGDGFSKANFSTIQALLYNNQTISDLPAKYDLLQDELYFQTKQGLRVLDGTHIKSYSFIDSITKKKSNYINSKEFKLATSVPLKGFFEILYDGKMALFKKEEATIQKANYHVALNVGRQDHHVNKKSFYYYLQDDTAIKLPSKSITSIFGDQKAAVDRYIKINQLDIKNERHLISVFEYYNQFSSN